METLFILLKNYQSVGEAFFIGLMQGLLLFGVVAIYRAIKNAKQKNHKDWNEVSKDETRNAFNGKKTDWEEIKKGEH